ncbi:MAG: phytanoyl-CoA dioxygenase family protein, partial [Hyphomicrobiaceae bacterium]
MNTAEALEILGVDVHALTPEHTKDLDEKGYFIFEGFFSKETTDEMRAEFDRLREIEGDFGGHEVHIEPGAPRLANLFNKSPVFDKCLTCAPTLAAAHHLLGEIHTYSLNGRNPLRGQGQQPLHSDEPRTAENDWRLVNSMSMLDDMTEDNGATRVVPGSHKWVSLNVPDVNMAEVKAIEVTAEDRKIMPANPAAPYPG